MSESQADTAIAQPSVALRAVRTALSDTPAWLVGGAPRDRVLGRETADLDIVVAGSPAVAARAIAEAAGGAACFELSEEFSGWRVVARDRTWQVDVQPLRGSLEHDLTLRDFTVGAIAEPVAGGEPIDPLGGLADIAARRLRMVSPHAFVDDPLRILRSVRLALDLGFEVDHETERAARTTAPELREVSGERVFMELRRIIASPHALDGLRLMDTLGATAVVLPELDALQGVRQSRYHHRDVHGHTLEVLEHVIALQADPVAVLAGGPGGSGAELAQSATALAESGEMLDQSGGMVGGSGAMVGGSGEMLDRARATLGESGEMHGESGAMVGEPGATLGKSGTALIESVAALLAEPLADELTRGEALRWGALLHDIAKPLTAGVVEEDGRERITFMGHDVRGAELARTVLGRLRTSERLRAHVAALVRHHLRLGFLVHDPQPLPRRTVFDYLQATSPVEVDVTLLSIADRLATRGDRAREAIDAHMRLARAMLADALSWRAAGTPQPLWRGDELAAALGIAPGPRLGAVLHELAAARYAGEIETSEQALDHARRLIEAGTV